MSCIEEESEAARHRMTSDFSRYKEVKSNRMTREVPATTPDDNIYSLSRKSPSPSQDVERSGISSTTNRNCESDDFERAIDSHSRSPIEVTSSVKKHLVLIQRVNRGEAVFTNEDESDHEDI